MPITFKCKSKVDDKKIIQTKNYAISKDENKPDLEEYVYTSIFEFEGDNSDPLIV